MLLKDMDVFIPEDMLLSDLELAPGIAQMEVLRIESRDKNADLNAVPLKKYLIPSKDPLQCAAAYLGMCIVYNLVIDEQVSSSMSRWRDTANFKNLLPPIDADP
jgi:hypothetical protein